MIRLLSSTLLFILFFATLPSANVYAQNPAPAPVQTSSWKQSTPFSFGSALEGTAMNAQSAWHTGTQYVMYSLTCLITGADCSYKLEDLPANMCGSALGHIDKSIAATFVNRPADTGLWLADTGRTLGFLPREAVAQGIGFSGMQPLLPIWKAFRNISYMLMAVVMIALGFMIMFRKKIDPKTVVTAQNAIPRVVIALILITFSYAIVGVLIDFMYVIIYFLIALFKSTGLLDNPSYPVCLAYKTPELLYGQGGMMANFMNIPKDPYRLIFGATDNFLANSGTLSGIGLVLALLGTAASVPPVATGIAAGAFIGLPILHLIISIIIIFLFLRLAFFFLGAYIQIVISLLLAPLQLLFEAVPGSTAFSSWISNLIANLAVFPVGAAMFMLSNVFTHFANVNSGTIWAPPYAPISGNASQLSAIIALGVLFAIPQTAGAIKEALKAKPVMGGGSGSGGGLQNAATILSMAYYAQSFTPQGLKDRIFGGGGDKKGGH